MQVGDSIEMPRPKSKGIWQSQFYDRAGRVGIRSSVRTIDDDAVSTTRIA
jgi:hypothetical protein